MQRSLYTFCWNSTAVFELIVTNLQLLIGLGAVGKSGRFHPKMPHLADPPPEHDPVTLPY